MLSGIFCILDARRNLGDRYTYHSRLITFSLRRECIVREKFVKFFFHTDSAPRASSNSLLASYLGFSAILESFSRGESFASWYSNIQMLKKAAVLFFSPFAKQLRARYAMLWKHFLPLPLSVIYTIRVQLRRTRNADIYLIFPKLCACATWRLWD